MKRLVYQSLKDWVSKVARKPLILRGARQVGKTHIIKTLGKEFRHFLMVNFEKHPMAKDLFEKDLDAGRIMRDLSLMFNVKIIPGETLLFFDEIQEAPKALTALRYFYEELPELHVIAAGSLIDFAIEEVGIPVGRVEFLYLYPMSFVEFLVATGREHTAEIILTQTFPDAFHDNVHEQLLDIVGEYLAVGGMPEVVKHWRDHHDLEKCGEIKHTLIDAYRQDFEKYSKKHQIKYLDILFEQIPQQLAQPFKFANISGDYRKRELAPCLSLLTKAQVVKSIYHSDGQGLPLGAQASLDIFKTLFIDVALAQTVLGDRPKDWLLHTEQTFANKGAIIESFVGQELLAYGNPHIQSTLYYWHRMARNSNAEVDYLIDYQGHVIPVEVKGGSGSTLKSMHIFLDTHPHSPYGIRFSTQPYSLYQNIHSYPLYAIAALFQEYASKIF